MDPSLDSTDLTWLAGLARALLGEPHAADDLVQDTAVAALLAPPPVGAPRRAWLGAVARRLAARRFRGEARRARREEHAARPEALPDSSELVARAEVAEQVTAAARRLPEPYRRTILLRFLEGRSAEEIAREEGRPVDSVRWRVRRGLELLREELVRRHDREWSSWSVLLVPLARSRGDVGLATAGASGVSAGLLVSTMAMKTTVVVAAALGCAGLWLVWDSAGGERGAEVERAAVEVAPVRPATEPAGGPESVEPAQVRSAAAPVREAEAAVEVVEAVAAELFGEVVDEEGAAVGGAELHLLADAETEDRVRARTASDARGAFRIGPEAWAAAPSEVLDLVVVANGFRRRVLPDVTREPAGEPLRVVLERGRTLSGRVVDPDGRPVAGLELLAHSAYAGVAHVSPSQSLLRARRRQVAGAESAYDQCRATTDAIGQVRFTGLPPGDLQVLPLAPGWTIEDPGLVPEGETYVEWTAAPRLGVRLVVIDARTGRPAERAAATFGFELTFADGEVRDFSQWVGRGDGEVSFVLGDEELPGLEARAIRRAGFYGTVRAGDGERVDWTAEPIEGPTGVAEVRVEVDPTAAPERTDVVALDGSATLEVDARYADLAPFEGELRVRWASPADPSDVDGDDVEAVGLGRYRLEVPAGDLLVEVSDRYGSGSLPGWTTEVRCEPGRTTTVFATLPRGASATIPRPEGWSGEWFVNCSWRTPGTEEWQGSLGYSTAERRMVLTVLRPAEWRFELRRDSALSADPLVRTVVLEDGESAVVSDR